MSLNERIAYSGTIMGMALLVVLLSLFSLLFGFYALAILAQSKRNIRRENQRIQTAAYVNPQLLATEGF